MNSIYQLKLLSKFVVTCFPKVNNQLVQWRYYASNYCEEALGFQAVSSIDKKKFHCLGGSVYSLYSDYSEELISFIVCYQTISDYLDNLCDRAGITDELAFRQLHLSMQDALISDNEYNDYYRYYTYTNDGGYLKGLVTRCKRSIAKLPSYEIVKPYLLKLESLYSNLQIYKHIAPEKREEALFRWSNEYKNEYKELFPWEFWAATGSTLGIFYAVAMAQSTNIKENDVKEGIDVYFPWISALHILLDYFIDMDEDHKNGDLNFISYYFNLDEAVERLKYIIEQCVCKCSKLRDKDFHLTIIYGLLSLYLSDSKVSSKEFKKYKQELFKSVDKKAKLMYKSCNILRKIGCI